MTIDLDAIEKRLKARRAIGACLFTVKTKDGEYITEQAPIEFYGNAHIDIAALLEECRRLRAIVEGLAALHCWIDEYSACRFCLEPGSEHSKSDDDVYHAEDCPWRRATEYMREREGK